MQWKLFVMLALIWGRFLDMIKLESEPHGRPKEVIYNDELRSSVDSDTRQSIQDIEHKLGVYYTSIARHLKIIGKLRS